MHKLTTILLGAVLTTSAFATQYTFTPNPSDLGDLNHTSAYTWGISSSGLLSQLSSGYTITSATLTITNLYNWNSLDTNNQLFIHLLDNPISGVASVTDDPYDNGINTGTVSDYFGGSGSISTNWYWNDPNAHWKGKTYVAYGYDSSGNLLPNQSLYNNIYLTQYNDPNGPNSIQTFTFNLTTNQLSTLSSYILNGHSGSGNSDFGLGFDPDCHFYNSGVTFQVNTAPASVPDSGATALLLLLGLAGVLPVCRRVKR